MIRSGIIPPLEEPRPEGSANDDLFAEISQHEIEATLSERMEAMELTLKIIECGLLEE